MVMTLDPYKSICDYEKRVTDNCNKYMAHLYEAKAFNSVRPISQSLQPETDGFNCGVFSCFYITKLIDQVAQFPIKSCDLTMKESPMSFRAYIKSLID